MEDGLSPFPFLSLNCPCRALDVDSMWSHQQWQSVFHCLTWTLRLIWTLQRRQNHSQGNPSDLNPESSTGRWLHVSDQELGLATGGPSGPDVTYVVRLQELHTKCITRRDQAPCKTCFCEFQAPKINKLIIRKCRPMRHNQFQYDTLGKKGAQFTWRKFNWEASKNQIDGQKRIFLRKDEWLKNGILPDLIVES